MLQWWDQAQLKRADLAIRRCDGAMLWHRDVALADLPLSWARAQNSRGADIYIRPARGYAWPIVFLDDVAIELALSIAQRVSVLLVHTSRQGGFHLWLRCAHPLSETARRDAQRWLAAKTAADTASTSGEHLGRLAGMRNYKRDAQWVNLVSTSTSLPAWTPAFDRRRSPMLPRSNEPSVAFISGLDTSATSRARTGLDLSPSGSEWGWVCGALEAGLPPQRVYAALLDRCRHRRGPDAERYASLTLQRAMRHTHTDDITPLFWAEATRGSAP
jgi:hypothetical protein